MFAHDDLFVAADVQLALGWNTVETPSAATALHRHNTEAVAGIGANTVVGAQQALFDVLGGCFAFLGEVLLLLLRLPFAVVVPLAVGGMHSILAREFVVFSRKEEVTRSFVC